MMKKINVILLMAGKGVRTNLNYNKVLYEVNNLPIYIYSLQKFITLKNLNQLYLVVNHDDFETVQEEIKQNNYNVVLIEGGNTRAESVRLALKEVGNCYDILIHDAARPLTSLTDIKTLIEETDLIGTLYHDIVDTIKIVIDKTQTIDRSVLKAVTTPQYFSKLLIDKIINNSIEYTDEIQIFEDNSNITYVKETSPNLKVTTKDDLEYISFRLFPNQAVVGHSYDFHPFIENRKLVLGGVEIPYSQGLKGHSDADALYHAVSEAIIGALNMGDIGTHFPDNDPKYKNMSSSFFVKSALNLMHQKKMKVYNIDAIIYIEEPKLVAYKTQMAQNIKELTNANFVNVKATTMEKQGLVGESKGIGCEVVCLLVKE